MVAIVDVYAYLKVEIFDCVTGASFFKTVAEVEGLRVAAGLDKPARESVRLMADFLGAAGYWIIFGYCTVFNRDLVGIIPPNYALAFLASASYFFSAIVFTAVLTRGRVLIGSFDFVVAVPGLSIRDTPFLKFMGTLCAEVEVVVIFVLGAG